MGKTNTCLVFLSMLKYLCLALQCTEWKDGNHDNGTYILLSGFDKSMKNCNKNNVQVVVSDCKSNTLSSSKLRPNKVNDTHVEFQKSGDARVMHTFSRIQVLITGNYNEQNCILNEIYVINGKQKVHVLCSIYRTDYCARLDNSERSVTFDLTCLANSGGCKDYQSGTYRKCNLVPPVQRNCIVGGHVPPPVARLTVKKCIEVGSGWTRRVPRTYNCSLCRQKGNQRWKCTHLGYTTNTGILVDSASLPHSTFITFLPVVIHLFLDRNNLYL